MLRNSRFEKSIFFFLLSGFVLFSCHSSKNAVENAVKNSLPIATANITATYADTAVSGKAVFTKEKNGKIKLQLNLHIPAKANKEVAVHIHEHGDCGNTGNNAHGHWNPTKDTHGKWGSAHFHLGDIGNVSLNANGDGSLNMETNLWDLGGDSTKNILGRAIIVHSGQDNYVSQPTGNAGGRIGCGVIQ